MRTLLPSIAAAAALFVAAPASAISITIGNSLASACYRSSQASVAPRFALDECDRAIEEEVLSDEDRAATFVNRGILKMRVGSFRGAEDDFDTAIAMDPAAAEAYLNKAFLRLRQGQYREALPFLDRSLAAGTIRPALAHYARAIVHEQLGNVRAAYADLLKARDADPSWDLPELELARFRVSSR